MPKVGERGIIHILGLLILLGGIIGGVYLVTAGPLKLFPRATSGPISGPVIPSPTPNNFSALSATLTATSATFNFTANGVSGPYRIDMSTRSDMSWDVYLTFGSGENSPIAVANPTSRWDKYVCGSTLYWRVLDNPRRNQSAIQSAAISCLSPAVSPERVTAQQAQPTLTLQGFIRVYNAKRGDSRYDAVYDANKDGTINLADYSSLRTKFR